MSAAVQRSFSSGEISPGLGARADLVSYQNGVAKLLNCVVGADGGFMNRGGSKVVAATKLVEIAEGQWAHSPSRIIEFEFNTIDQNYFLEMGEHYVRFHQNGAPVLVSGVVPYTGGFYTVGDLASYLGVNYVALSNSSGAHAPPNATYWYPLEADIFEIPTSWTLDEVNALQFVQKGDVIDFVHKSHLLATLTRLAQTKWTITDTPQLSGTFFNSTIGPVTTLVNNSPGAGGLIFWHVFALGENGEESPLGAATDSSNIPTAGSPITLSWIGPAPPAHTNILGYNIYREDGAGIGFIGFTSSLSFVDFGVISDTAEIPVLKRSEFTYTTCLSNDGFPSVISNYQQRRIVANAYPLLTGAWGSRIGVPGNFDKKFPIPADGSMNFTVEGRRVSEIRHLIDIGVLVAFTDQGEVVIKGDLSGVLRPGESNPQFYSYNGASRLRPLVIGSNALYVQQVGSLVRDLGYDVAAGGKDGYRDLDLTSRARHLIKGRTIVDWCFQKSPFPVVWAIRDDGVCIAVTYEREQQILGWHRHTTKGLYERAGSVHENGEHAVYRVVARTIDGEEVRFIERDAPRFFTDIRDAVFMDCAITYDGRNTDASKKMLLKGGTEWTAEEEMILEANVAFFTDDDIGNVIQLSGVNDAGVALMILCEITGFTDTQHVKVRPDKDVPEAMQEELLSTWAKAVDVISGLDHLEGEDVSVLGDGAVLSSPNNPKAPTLTVTNGQIELDACFAVVQVGLPYISDFETLNLEIVNGETLSNKFVLVNEATLFLEESRGLFVGSKEPTGADPLEGLQEIKPVGVEYNIGVPLLTGKARAQLRSEWTNNGRVFGRQVDPLPFKVNAIVPTGFVPGGR